MQAHIDSPAHAFVLPPCGARILVAEDDPDMRDLITVTLRADGHAVTEAANGAEMLSGVVESCIADNDRYDLVLADVSMPVLTGLAAASRLKGEGYGVPMILMTAFGDLELRAEITRLGIGLLDKPFDLDDLRTAVRSMLKT